MTPLSFQIVIYQEDLFLTGFIKIQRGKKVLEMYLINPLQKIKKSLNLSCKIHTYLLILAYLFMKKTPKLTNRP